MADIKYLTKVATQVRRDIIRMINLAKSGHPGGALSAADFLVALYFEIMKHSPENWDMEGKGQDVFFLSNGHISAAWYSVLARSGYFPIKELATFRRINSRLQGHPATAEGLPGVRVASGSLGQGLSVAIGMALAKKLNNDNTLVFSLHGDGELQEGQIWEAAMFAGAKKLDNLIATVDFNDCQIEGHVHEVMDVRPLKDKWCSFGWKVLETEGNDMEKILATLNEAKSLAFNGYPIVILMRTQMGKGVDFMLDQPGWHGKAPSDEQAEKALSQLEETLGDFPIE